MKKFLLLAIGVALLWTIFFLFFVFPNPFFKPEVPEAGKFSKSKVAYDVIDNISHYICKGKWARKDFLNGGCQVSLGKYKGLVESKRAIPNDKTISFYYFVKEGDILVFSAGTGKSKAGFEILINDKTVFKRELNIPPKRGWLYHHFLKYFYFHPVWQNGIWKDFVLSLGQWAGKEVKITLKGRGGFWGNPQIIEPVMDKEKIIFPNLIMIQVDALRADLVGKGIFPNIDRLAKEGAFFVNAHSNGNWTRPSNIHQFFARFNREIGLNPEKFFIPPLAKEIFYRRKFPSIPSVLKKHGYRTIAIGDNIFLHGYSTLGIDFGFEDVVDMERERYQSPLIYEKAVKWLKKNNGVPFFMFLDFNQTHRPYRPPINLISIKGLLKDYEFELYKDSALYTDIYIGKLLKWLESAGLLKNTLIVLNADHGERFRFYRNLQPHGETLLEEEIRVPLIFYWKGKIKSAKLQTPVSIIDIAKTTASLIGIKYPKGWRGRDLSFFILEGKNPPEEAIILEGRRSKGLIFKGWKLILKKGRNETVRRIYGNSEVSKKELLEKFYSLYPPQPDVLLTRFNIKQGEITISPFSSVEIMGGKGKIKTQSGKITLEDKGFLYFILRNGFTPLINFKGGKLRFTQMEIPWGENTIKLTPDLRRKIHIPNAFFYADREGITVAVIPLLNFVYSPQFSQEKSMGAVKSILIEWGYMKK